MVLTSKEYINESVNKKIIPDFGSSGYYPIGHDDYLVKKASDRVVNYNFKGANRAIGLIESELSYLFFIDTLPSAYLSTEFSQCVRLESKLSALESQIETMPDGPIKDKLLARVESSLKYLEFKKERIIELEIKFKDEDYDQQLEMIRLHFKKSKAEFEYFIKEQNEFQNHLKSEVYWDKLLEVLGEYGRAYDHIYADSISDIELLKIILKNTNEALTPEFESKLIKSMEQDARFKESYIKQKMNSLKVNPVNIRVMLDKKSLMEEGVEQHILICQHEGKEVRFSIKRDKLANSFEIIKLKDFTSKQDLDHDFLSLYANNCIGLNEKDINSSPKSMLELSKNNFEEDSKESSEDITFETN